MIENFFLFDPSKLLITGWSNDGSAVLGILIQPVKKRRIKKQGAVLLVKVKYPDPTISLQNVKAATVVDVPRSKNQLYVFFLQF